MTFQAEEASPSEHEREQKVRLRRAGRRSVPTTATAMVLAAASIAVFALAFVATGSSSRAKELATDGQSRIAGSIGLATSAPLPGRAPDAATAATLVSRAWSRPIPAAVGSVASVPPNRLYIPSLAVYAPIDVAWASGGELQLPEDASRVARYESSPGLAADAGTTILAGHVTNTPQIGALFPLATIRRGALVYTTDPHDRLRTWRVTSISAPLKANLPRGIFTSSGPRRLAIVTCGGTVTWNANGTRSYPRNVIVIAQPVSNR